MKGKGNLTGPCYDCNKKDKKTFGFIDLYNILERRCIYSSEKGSLRATPRSRVLARLASLAQKEELARRL